MFTSFEQLSKVPMPEDVEANSADIKSTVSNTVPENSKEGLEPKSDDTTITPTVEPDDSDNDDDSEDKEIVEDVKEEKVVEPTVTVADGGTIGNKDVSLDEHDSVEETPGTAAPVEDAEQEQVPASPKETPEVAESEPTPEVVPTTEEVPTDTEVSDKLKDKNPKVTGVSADSDKQVTLEAPQVEEDAGITEEPLEEEAGNQVEDTDKDAELIKQLVNSVATLTNKLQGFQDKVEGLVESSKLDIPAVTTDSTEVDTTTVDSTEESVESDESGRKSAESASTGAPEEGTRPQTVPSDITDVQSDTGEQQTDADVTDDTPEQTEEEKEEAVKNALDSLDAQWPTLSPKLTDVERIAYLRAIRHIRFGEGTAEDANIIESTHRAVESREKETEEK